MNANCYQIQSVRLGMSMVETTSNGNGIVIRSAMQIKLYMDEKCARCVCKHHFRIWHSSRFFFLFPFADHHYSLKKAENENEHEPGNESEKVAFDEYMGGKRRKKEIKPIRIIPVWLCRFMQVYRIHCTLTNSYIARLTHTQSTFFSQLKVICRKRTIH